MCEYRETQLCFIHNKWAYNHFIAQSNVGVSCDLGEKDIEVLPDCVYITAQRFKGLNVQLYVIKYDQSAETELFCFLIIKNFYCYSKINESFVRGAGQQVGSKVHVEDSSRDTRGGTSIQPVNLSTDCVIFGFICSLLLC